MISKTTVLTGYLEALKSRLASAEGERDQYRDLAEDAVSGLRYVEHRYGRLDGIGWDRVFDALAALTTKEN